MATLSPVSTPSAPATEPRSPRRLTVLAAAVVAGLLLWFARAGLFAYFTGDDLMNIFFSWQKSYSRILLGNVLFFTPEYRPMGSLVYRLLFDIAGLHALPFRLVCFALILGNLYLLYRVAAAIASKEVGLLAALFASYNAGFSDLYYNTGTIYDLLCFTFYFLALGLYVDVRRQGDYLSLRNLALFLVFYVCALNSKEVAVTLPGVLIAYELILGRSGGVPTRQTFVSRWRPAALSAGLTLPYVLGKLSAASPLMGNDAYRLHLGLRTYFRAMGHYLEIFAYLQSNALTIAATVAALVLLGAIAVFGRRPGLLFAWLFTLITPLPVVFVPPRGGYAMYIPSFGMVLFLAVLAVEFRKELVRWIAGLAALPPQTRTLLQVDTFILCLILLLTFHNSRPLGDISAADALIRSTATQIGKIQPKLNPEGRVLFLDDPFAPEDLTPLLLLRLTSRAPDLVVDRVKAMPVKPDQKAIDGYDCIFDYKDGQFVRVKP